ncbi:NADPH reductase TAH18 [Zea mays]|uniref:NADPH reductase TAH18 n=1 Tax=Zea mays TaxID=4577 RepID=A0A1D6ND25_MAIZE|nr:NADPH reductase TAH18 [Zea mays]ONM38392.1 NADPH reductase TAH18 [Zea mays]
MAPSSAEADSAVSSSGRLLVLYASQTGNAMDAAERVGREAERGGCPAVDVLSMDSFDPSRLPSERFVVFVVSTTGQGDPPDSMKGFWRYMLRKDLDRQWLEGIHHAVFGLGDSGYQKYNFAAKKLDRRLLHLGAEPVLEIGLGDDQHPSGYEGALDPWLLSMWKSLNEINPSLLPRVSDINDPNLSFLGDPKVHVIYYSSNEVTQDPILLDSNKIISSARSMSPALRFHADGEPPYMLQMIPLNLAVELGLNSEKLATSIYIGIKVKKQCLTKEGTDRDVRHFELEDPSSVCHLYYTVMSFFATSEREKERLQYFASPEGRDDLYQYNQKESRTVLEVLEDFPSVQMPFEWLVQLTPPLKKRAFSISSSPLAHPNQIHLTVSVVAWVTPFKRTRRGLCSTWLAGLNPNKGNLIPCWIHQGSLPPPRPLVPLVLIGPGTGCAPFRAFVEERAAQAAAEPTAPVLFFFGCRNQENDFLYKDFWLTHAQDEGVLSSKRGGGFFVAFSRDQPQKALRRKCLPMLQLR